MEPTPSLSQPTNEKSDPPPSYETSSTNDALRYKQATSYPISTHNEGYATAGFAGYPPQPPQVVAGSYMPPVQGVAVVQPITTNHQAVGFQIAQPEVPNHMGCSIFTTLFCCFFFGITAVVFSAQANSMRHQDPEKARRLASTAKCLNIVSVVIGVVVIIAVVVLRVIAAQSSSYYYG